jgi:glycosyltransferase involved in cell wall biosynthesis
MATLDSSSSLRISIALCTCNGTEFLPAQLGSLLAQSKLPDELVICDDASDDSTWNILEAFADRAPFPVRLHRNPTRLGIGANFEQAIRRCDGDIVALCDQDDVWLPEKLVHLEKALAAGGDWATCDVEVTDKNLAPLGYTLWERVGLNRRERHLARQGEFFQALLKHSIVAGAALTFRAGLRDKLLPIPMGWHYDAWLAAVLAATAPGSIVEVPLQYYRQHGTNAVGGLRRNLLDEVSAAVSIDRQTYYAVEIARWANLAKRLKEVDAPLAAIQQLDSKLIHLGRRARLPANRFARLPAVAAEIVHGGYARYSRNWGSIALDLMIK